MKHIKTFESFLNERSLQTPISIEMEAGDVKVFADPNAENWLGETVRTRLYEKLKEDFIKAIKDEDDSAIQSLLQKSKELPLFAQDKSEVWKMTQVDGIEKFRSEAEHRRYLAAYVVSKIKYFLDWVHNTEGKKTK